MGCKTVAPASRQDPLEITAPPGVEPWWRRLDSRIPSTRDTIPFNYIKGNGPRCERWPEHLRLVNEPTGEAIMGRCKATNLCPYCRNAYLAETAEILRLDAASAPPTIYSVLTARAFLERESCRYVLDRCRRRARKRWPDTQWFVACELQKRGALHLNLLVKGVSGADVELWHYELADEWCSRFDAEEPAQHSEAIWDAEGVSQYVQKVSSYVAKESQQPGDGWRGHRHSSTRGYFVAGTASMREQVRELARERRARGQALAEGLRGEAAEARAAELGRLAQLDVWQMLDIAAPARCARIRNEPRRTNDREIERSASAADALEGVKPGRKHARNDTSPVSAPEQVPLPGYDWASCRDRDLYV